MIRKHTRRAAKAAFAISFGVAIIIGVFAGTARPATHAGPTIVMGNKNFDEQRILGQLYKQALEAKGFEVDFKGDQGPTEIIHLALTSGKINFYPEYTGTIVSAVYHKTEPKTAVGTGAEWFSPIQPVTNGKSDSQKRRWRFAQSVRPWTLVTVWSMWWWLFQ